MKTSKVRQHTFSIWSRFLRSRRDGTIAIFGPKAKKAKVLIFLDGELFRNRLGMERYLSFMAERLNIRVDAAFVECGVESNRFSDFTCNVRFGSFLSKELIPKMHSLLGHTWKRSDCTILGLSLSGLCAAHLLIRNPGIAGNLICCSPSIWFKNNAVCAEFASAKIPVTNVFLNVGKHETTSSTVHVNGKGRKLHQHIAQLDSVRQFRDVLLAKKFPLDYCEFDGGHDPDAWARLCKKYLKTILAKRRKDA